MQAPGVDLLLFAGGDGTARDIVDAVGLEVPVLGIPVGVKMQSGVFAISPDAAGELLLGLEAGELVDVRRQEVRDIDEEALRRGEVRSRFYGELSVPAEGRFLQHTKVGGRESEELVAAEIASWMAETMEPGCLYLSGPGSTTAAIMEQLGLANTLLGVDAVLDGELVASDADGKVLDVDLTAEDWQAVIEVFKTITQWPQDPFEQLKRAVEIALELLAAEPPPRVTPPRFPRPTEPPMP